MPNGTMPYVAVVGGLWKLEPPERSEASQLAQELGAAMAKAGLGLVVYFSDEGSLEPHVVKGYVGALRPGAGAESIRVRYSEAQRDVVRFAEQSTHRDIFLPRVYPSNEWEAPFYRSLVDADGVDAVLLMAGHRSTLIAGQIAVARPLPVLAVDKFGGSAQIIWSELARGSQTYPSSTTSTPDQLVAWLKQQTDERARRRREAMELEQASRRAASQASNSLWVGGAFAVLLTILFFGTLRVPNAQAYAFVMFAALIAGGATGALVRAAYWRTSDTSPVTSLILGSVAGFVVGIAYLIPQFVGAPGPLNPDANVVDANDKIQLLSSLLVAITAGVGFDTVFSRLKQQAEQVPIGPK